MFTQQGGGIVSALAVIVCLASLLGMSESTQAARLKVFSVDAFGAKPNQRVDSGPAARAAVQRAIQSGGGIVQFGPGKYYMMSADRNAYALWPTGAANVHVTGVKGKTEIIVTDPHIGFLRWDRSKNCAASNFIVDYETPPFTQGKILAVDRNAGTFDLKIDKGFPQLDAKFFNRGREWGMPIHPTEPRPKYCWLDHVWVKDWQSIGEGTWRLTCQNKPNARELAAGDRYVQLARQKNHGVFGVWLSSQILMQDIIVHASPGITNGVVMSDAVVYRRFQVRFRKGTKRVITSNGDGIHVHGNRRGPLIEKCYFEGICDDGVNLNSHMNAIMRVVKPNEIVVDRKAVDFKVGDAVQIVEPATGLIRATTTITAVRGLGQEQFALRLKDAVEGMKPNQAPEQTGGGGRGRRGRRGVRLTGGDVLYNLGAANAGFTIRNNTFRGHRRFGLLIRSGKGVIENNTFDRLCGVGILITNGMALEGPIAFDVTIRNNKLIGVGQSRNSGESSQYGAITVRTNRTGHKPAPQRGITNIKILNNQIIDPPKHAIYVVSAKDVTIKGNSITATADSTAFGANTGLCIENSEGVVVENLSFSDPRKTVRAGVHIRSSVAAGEKGVTLKNLKLDLPQGVPEVLDERR